MGAEVLNHLVGWFPMYEMESEQGTRKGNWSESYMKGKYWTEPDGSKERQKMEK